MDSTEELSARVLLKHILDVETPRTPLTRSVAAQSGGLRRSGRLNKNDPHTPQAKLRQSLKQKMRESISSQTLPSKRRTASTVLKQTSGPASMIFDDDATPRQILKNILLTEPVKSPVVNEHLESQEPQPSPDSIPRGSGTELSGLELSDLTICNVESTVKGLNRKRPPRSLNVTAFEKRLKGENDLAEGQGSIEGDSSLSMSSSLSLKTPFIDVRTERKALQRKGLHRRKVLEEEFGAAVARREMENDHGIRISAPGQVHRESTYSEGITLGPSEISEPDITIDFVSSAHCSKTHGIISNYSRLATQDKSTVMASQIQRDLKEMLDVNEQHYSFAVKENPMTDAQDGNQFLTAHNDNTAKDAAAPCQSEQEESLGKRTFDIGDSEASKNIENVDDYNSEKAISQTDNSGPFSSSESEDKADIQTQNQGEDEDEDDDELKKEDPATEQQSHQEATLTLEKEGTDSQMNGDKSMQDGAVEDGEEEMEDGEEEEVEEEEVEDAEEEEVEDAEEEEVEDAEEEEVEDAEEEEVEDAEGVVEDGEYREEELAERGGDETEQEEGLEQTDANVEGKDEVDLAVGDSESNEEVADSQEDEDGNSEHITPRAVSAEDELIVPIPKNDADLPHNSKPGYNVISEPSILKDATEVEADGNENKENAFQESGPPEDVELVEQSVEDEDDLPSKTPAFVKQKRNFFHSDPQASPFAPKNIQPSDAGPGPKSKQKAQRKLRSPKSDPGLSKSYLMKVIKHFAKTKVSTDVYPIVKDVMDTFLDRLAKDLEAYALHARRSTIGVADCELLLRRQGHVNDKVPVEVLIEKYLRMDQRKLLIPIATSGNVVFPKKL